LGGLERAVAADIPTAVVERKTFDDVAAFSQTIFRLCDGVRADLVLLAGWLQLLRIPAMYEGRVMNIHPALLPKFGGKGMWGHHVHEAVLAAGERESGCTVHLVNNEYDAGPVVLQRACPVLPGDTPDTLAARVFEEEKLAYPDAVRAFASGRLLAKD
jgi:phosphoribosylglycinamide formyltransferase-1